MIYRCTPLIKVHGVSVLHVWKIITDELLLLYCNYCNPQTLINDIDCSKG